MGNFNENDIVLDNYRIERSIGQGAFGEVYLATDTGLNGKRAIKVLLRDDIGVGSSDYNDYRNRFRLEAQLMEWFNNPHIIRVYNFLEKDNVLYLIMEYAGGGSLKHRMDQAKKDSSVLSIDESVKIALNIAEGLSALHAKDVIHRDLKPSNILFDAEGNAKVADLGLAQVPGGPSLRSQLSIPVPHPGTPAYMSPEHANSSNYLTPASDIYSLGLILFEMITGRNFKTLRPGTRLSGIMPSAPGWLDGLVSRMLSENIKDRPWDGTETAELLREGLVKLDKAQAEKQKTADTVNVADDSEMRKKAEEAERAHRKEEIRQLEAQCKVAIQNQDWNAANRVIKTLKGMGNDGQSAAELCQADLDNSRKKTRSSDSVWKKFRWLGILAVTLIILTIIIVNWPAQPVIPTAVPVSEVPAAPIATVEYHEPTLEPVAPAAAAPDPKESKKFTYQDMTMCFPQMGAESSWREANTASFKETAAKLGVGLIFSDAQQKQENQIAAMRACIAQGVSVIALPPIVQDGWESVLQEAKDAAIPVIIIDRAVSADPSLFAAHIGSDMVIEGEKAGSEMNKLLPNGGKIVELRGTDGSGAAVGRANGFRNTLNSNIQMIDTQTANFNRTESKPAMAAMLKKYGKSINGLFSHNDDMTMGAIAALRAAGFKPGDVKIVSVDGNKEAFQALMDGWISAEVECSPMIGPQAMETALKVLNGEPVDQYILTNEGVFYPDQARGLISTRQY